MSTIIIQPHCDDALFSLATFITTLPEAPLIVAPFAGIPDCGKGKRKHTIYRAEHEAACANLGTPYVNGDFLDDVYPLPDRVAVKTWLSSYFIAADELYIPLGIHHPDHVLTSNLLIELIHTSASVPQIYVYEELPYRVDYPDKTRRRLNYMENVLGRMELVVERSSDPRKEAVVRTYKSQTDDDVVRRVMGVERIWRVIR